ncbi:Fatty acid hydroxylase [Cordyceps fumosorosea ARSEF 2679]|uniref:Fatty acid hydroxylase n=1 Tax=Cordyceps fumosorosea (strain ARSEF 2679) TaxID=1081104 RepID=A0A162K668_CORFA|nr:Fatty acid hydroxylase [Cordyceps fumosorosea ARSEF 2679]OAA53868.1 Fatty acid hydroxylase [Cordyceps fumosorosea ARSEF 2679]
MATTTTTTTTTTRRNPKDSIKSTWRLDPKKDGWTLAHHLFGFLDIHQSDLSLPPAPVHPKNTPVPHLPNWQLNAFVIFWGAVPLLAHQAWFNLTGLNLPLPVAYAYYALAVTAFGVHELRMLRRVGRRHGYLDGDAHARDDVPDATVGKVASSLLLAITFRPAVLILLAYRADRGPPADSPDWWWLPVQAAAYPIVTDFWFYWYHRLMHEVPALWKFHRTHHLTKHPNALLTIFADAEQEAFDIAVIPALAFYSMKLIGLEMGFYAFWMCHMYVWFTELLGHSGLRVHLYAASPISGLLGYLGVELALEDHDLHHRTGWKNSHNYGKQSRVWDRVFGTCAARIECQETNVNYEDIASFPLF